MSRAVLLATALGLLLAGSAALAQHQIIQEVRIHGNHTTPDADILALAGLAVGTVATDETLQEATTRLERSSRFDSVEVRKRFRSLDDPADILIVILVDEVAGVTADDLTPGPFKRLRSLGMMLPVLDYADGYGLTYGARITFVDVVGQRSRVSMPLTWGGQREAGIEVERAFARGPLTHVSGAATVIRRVNPHFDIPDTRREIRARAERAVAPWFRIGGGARLTDVSFGASEESYLVPHADITVDTRLDPGFPRNAVHATARLEQLRFAQQRHVTRLNADVRGYVGLFGSSVLAVRAAQVTASDAVPLFEQSLLGGAATLRGFDVGYRAGDNMTVLSAEVRVPLTSPLLLGRLGVKGFVDAGAVYPSGSRLSEQRFDRGVGAGVFMSWAVIHLGVDVAWPLDSEPRRPKWHAGFGVTF